MTPATSVTAFRGPGSPSKGIPRSRARGAAGGPPAAATAQINEHAIEQQTASKRRLLNIGFSAAGTLVLDDFHASILRSAQRGVVAAHRLARAKSMCRQSILIHAGIDQIGLDGGSPLFRKRLIVRIGGGVVRVSFDREFPRRLGAGRG